MLVLAAVAEATVFPAPTEALLAALILLRRPPPATFWIGLATFGSVLGAALGYAVGARLFENWIHPVMSWYDLAHWLPTVKRLYADNLALALSTSGYTPVPYLVYTTTAGALQIPFWPFLFWSLLGRALKYALIGGVAHLIGPVVKRGLQLVPPRVVLAVFVLLAVAYLFLRR